jgi:hypothetical protein
MRAPSKRALQAGDFEQSDRASDMVLAAQIWARATAHRLQPLEDWRAP